MGHVVLETLKMDAGKESQGEWDGYALGHAMRKVIAYETRTASQSPGRSEIRSSARTSLHAFDVR